MDDPQQHLEAALAEHLSWHGARLSFLAHFLLALIKVRSVNLAELATGFGGKAQVASHYKRLQRFIDFFGVSRIAALLADREFVGEDWFSWLQHQHIPFHLRIKRDTLIPNAWNKRMRADRLFASLSPNQVYHLPGRRPVWRCFAHLPALRLEDGELLIIASSGAPQNQAIDAYARRWEIETLFGCLKSRGFNFEDTHLVDP